jgi:diguanylate cyclase (GGDEF)-like protein/PAS domain S-box-containing protein
MTERAELLEATLESLPEGVALLGANGQIAFWNEAAHAITGFAAIDMIGRMTPEALQGLLEVGSSLEKTGQEALRGFPVHARHKLGRDVCAMARHLVLRDGLGVRIGTAVLFHPGEGTDALPQGISGEGEDVHASQEDLKDRLEAQFAGLAHGEPAFGVLWITVDQAHGLRQTHGAGACAAMLEKVERALAHGLRPAEHLGRWGEDEFLIISHEQSAALLAGHAQVLAGMARTADFRWWGDRISLTISVGAAQVNPAASVANLLERARGAMLLSFKAGGNQITTAPEGNSCSPS